MSSMLAPIFGIALVGTMILAIGSYARLVVPAYPNGDNCYEQEAAQEEQGPGGFKNWKKPLVTLVLSGQMHGFNDPCGCSDPQYGGLPRLYNFIESLKAKKWDVVGIDLGELPQIKGIHKQNLLKYELSIRALGVMNYRAVGIGRDEVLLPLGEGLVQVWDDKKPYPRLISASLADTAPGEKYHDLNVRPYEIIEHTTPKIGVPKIGVISLMGPDLRKELTPLEKFRPSEKELSNALAEFAKKGVEIGIILHHEYPTVNPKIPVGIAQARAIEKERRDLAQACAEFCDAERKKNKKIPPIQLMMVLTDESEPPMLLKQLDNVPTKTMEIGHKGRYIGLIGVYKTGDEFTLKHENVLMSPDWQTEKGKEKDNPVIALMEEYNRKLKNEDILAMFSRSPHFNQIPEQGKGGLKATYVGSARCIECHADAGQVWTNQGPKSHHKAVETLESLKNPSGRQFDPECMMCHTTGFKHPGGYNNLVTDLANWDGKPVAGLNPKKVKDHNDSLRGVGCESCHGPGSAHVKNPNDKSVHDLINPYRPTARERELEDKVIAGKKWMGNEATEYQQKSRSRMQQLSASLCMKCHDDQNDVHWGQKGHEMLDNWLLKKLIHHTPKNNNGAGNQPLPKAVEEPPVVIEIIQDKK
jgi:hypothetical protein